MGFFTYISIAKFFVIHDTDKMLQIFIFKIGQIFIYSINKNTQSSIKIGT